jgi:hypothetical protein
MSRKITDWKTPAFVYGLFAAVFFFAFFYAAFNNAYHVDHVLPGNNENHPEGFNVFPSPALVFGATWSGLRVLGLIAFFAVGVYLVALANDIVTDKWKNTILFVGLLISLACFFGSHSNKVAGNNKVFLKPDRYERVKNNKDSLRNLFDPKKFY